MKHPLLHKSDVENLKQQSLKNEVFFKKKEISGLGYSMMKFIVLRANKVSPISNSYVDVWLIDSEEIYLQKDKTFLKFNGTH